MVKIINVVGARPNFMKIAPIVEEMARRPQIEQLLVHTGQHYTATMSDLFFADLGIPLPDINLGVGSATATQQIAGIMIEFEKVINQRRPDWVVVVGDVNSTMACALVCSRMGVKLAHVEAGLRSFDRQMPEEINRVVTDALADLLLTPSRDADENLKREGIDAARIRLVGNVMIDTLFKHLPRAEKSTILQDLGLEPRAYCVLTLHRPSNVDNESTLRGILSAIGEIQEQLPVIFPIHPRTRARVAEFGLEAELERMKRLKVIEPLGYLDFLRLYSNSRLVMTDSGGIQEETTVLGIPCLTLRHNTERPITVTEGTNRVIGSRKEDIVREAMASLNSNNSRARKPELWDGRAAARIVDAILES